MLYVVTGPPASGKSTWVRERAKHGDVVVDYDLLAGVLSPPGSDPYRHPRIVRSVAYRARTAAIHEALKHAGSVDVYVIHSQPAADALARYAEHGAQVVTVDPGADVVLARIEQERPSTARAVALRWYASAADVQRGGASLALSVDPPAPEPGHPVPPPPRSSRTW